MKFQKLPFRENKEQGNIPIRYFWIFCLTILYFIFITVSVSLWIITLSQYGLSHNINTLPLEVTRLRAIAMWFSVVAVLTSVMNAYLHARLLEIEKHKWLKYNLYSGCILSFALIYNIYKQVEEKHSFREAISLLKVEYHFNTNLPLWFSNIKNKVKDKSNINKLTKIYIAALVCTFIGFFVVVIFPFFDPGNVGKPRQYFILNTLSFFTDITNILCLVFIACNLLFKNQSIFKNHTILSFICSYIMIVSLGAWVARIPNWANGN
ncbi:MAG: hypothetical protein ACRC4M_02135, partial [Mycoplasma sp.]